MRGAQVAMAVVVAAAVAGVAWTQVAVYRAEGVGSCGGGFLAAPALTDTLCAIKCSQNAWCEGFSFVEDVATSHGICRLHDNLIPPDGDPQGSCFVLDTAASSTTAPATTATGTTATASTASTNTASATTVAITSTSTSAASANAASTTSASLTTTPTVSVSVTTAPAPSASTSTTASTNTVSTTTTPATTVAATTASTTTTPATTVAATTASTTTTPATTVAATTASTTTTPATTVAATTASTTTTPATTVAATTASTTTTPATTVAATTASTTTTPATSTVTSTVAPVAGASTVVLSANCGSGQSVVGLSVEGDWFHIHRLFCLSPPAGLEYSAPATTNKCTQTLRNCMTMACPSGTVYRGPKSDWGGTYNACSTGFGSTVATLDNADCHVVEGALQTKPAIAGAAWVQWRYCESSSTAFYVMTEAVVTPINDVKSDLTSIKCCRVKPL